jgi:hypothetical protein
LNNEILIRNKGDIVARNMRRGLSAKDTLNAIAKIKAKGRRAVLTYTDLLADKLGNINLIISASGLLGPARNSKKCHFLLLLFAPD